MIDTVIFDLDDVLCKYDIPVRLQALAELSGRPVDDIHNDLWGSGFEDAADAGRYRDAETYLAAFAERLQYPISREEWIAARSRSMTPYTPVLQIAGDLKASRTIAILTNNVPLLRETLPEIFPQTRQLFGERIYFSCDLRTVKPDPDIFRQVAALCGSAPANCILIDDNRANVDGAAHTGLQAIHFADPNRLASQLGGAGIMI